jgi:uncharacterized phiE125 gp8 family phage protein
MLDLAKAKSHLRVDTESDDALVQTYLDASIAAVEGFSGHILQEREVRQSVDGLCGEVELSWMPVVSVSKVQYLDSDGVEQELVDGFLRVGSGNRFFVAPAIGSNWPQTYAARNAATVIYRAGYGGDAGQVPADLEAAVLLMVGHLYMNREAVTPDTAREVPLGVKTITDRYRPAI